MEFRTDHTPEWRAGQVRHTIDPGFVHFRKVESVLGAGGTKIIDEQIRRIPLELPEWHRQLRIQHIYTRTMRDWCELNRIRSLGDILARRNGRVFCSNVQLGPCPDLYSSDRVTSPVLVDGNYEGRVELRYSTRHIFGDTPRERCVMAALCSR